MAEATVHTKHPVDEEESARLTFLGSFLRSCRWYIYIY